jgi:hypothetical protein
VALDLQVATLQNDAVFALAESHPAASPAPTILIVDDAPSVAETFGRKDVPVLASIVVAE